jgi:cob(I)alamin adenosyltransferase
MNHLHISGIGGFDMKLYTRTGDQGMTGVIGGRVRKDDERVEAYGTIDELNAYLGFAICQMNTPDMQDIVQDLSIIQHELFDAGADLATVLDNPTYKITSEMVTRLEQWIDKYESETPPIRRFILPGGSPAAASLHVARTIARRAERRVVTISEQENVNLEIRRYLNRLSDYLFMIARVANVRKQITDVEYNPAK